MIALLIIAATISYGLLIISFQRGPLYINSNLFGAIVNFVGALMPLALFLLYKTSDESSSKIGTKAIVWLAIGGIAINVFTFAFAKIFSTGQNVNFAVPLVYGGAVLLSILASTFLFKEKQPFMAVLGAFLIVGGISCIVWSVYQKGLVK